MQAATSGNGISSLAGWLAVCLLLLHAVLPVTAAATQPPITDCARVYTFAIPVVSGKAAAAYPAEAAEWLHALIRDVFLDRHSGPETLSPIQRECMTGSLSFSFLGGTFLGALFFGYPYRGMGIPDLAALAVLGFVFVYAVMSKTRGGRPRKSTGPFATGQRNASSSDASAHPALEKKRDAGRKGTKGRLSGERAEPGNVWGAGRAPGLGDEDGLRRNRGSGLPDRDVCGPDGKKLRLPEHSGSGEKRTSSARPVTRPQPEPAVRPFSGTITEPVTDDLSGDVASEAFLEGVRTLYIRLQDAWAARDVEGLSPFMTPEMMRILREQAKADPHPVKVGIFQLTAKIITAEQTENQDWVEVAFAALMSTGGLPPVTVHEIWHFSRERAGKSAWRLAGIEPDGE